MTGSRLSKKREDEKGIIRGRGVGSERGSFLEQLKVR